MLRPGLHVVGHGVAKMLVVDEILRNPELHSSWVIRRCDDGGLESTIRDWTNLLNDTLQYNLIVFSARGRVDEIEAYAIYQIEPSCMWINFIFSRTAGMGSLVLRRCINIAKRMRKTAVWLVALSHYSDHLGRQTLRDFYSKFGFRDHGSSIMKLHLPTFIRRKHFNIY